MQELATETPAAGTHSASAPNEISVQWSPLKRIAFRFLFTFVFLLTFPFPFREIPAGFMGLPRYDKFWAHIAGWVGTHVFQSPAAFSHSPEFILMDNPFGYTNLFCFVIGSLLAMCIWSLLDRRRANYSVLFEALRIYTRYMLGFTMLAYGLDKVLALQFWPTGLDELAQPLGNYSRFALLWTFMGYSTPYTVFAGSVEVLGGLLLFFRRTATLGALIVCGAMANVVMLDFSYGVPVKLFASILLFLSVFLLAPAMPRLANLFVLNRTAEPERDRFRIKSPALRRVAPILTFAFILCSVYDLAVPGLVENRQRKNFPKSPFYGIFQVDSYLRDGKPLPASDKNWRRLILEEQEQMAVLTEDDTSIRFRTEYNVAGGSFTYSEPAFGQKQWTPHPLKFVQPDADHLELRGTIDNSPVIIKLHKVDVSKYQLASEKFRWNLQ